MGMVGASEATVETGKDDALLTSLGWACHCALPRHTLSKWAGPGPVLGLGFFVFLRSTRPPPLRSRSVCRGSVGAGALPCWRRSPTVVSAEGSNYSSAVMAAAGGGIAGGGGATTSGCGLKRRYAPHDQEEETMNQGQSSKEDWCGRLWNGMELLKDVTENKHVLPTGLEGIDTLLGGGLRQGQLTEVTGPSSSGKTQVCLHSASHAAVKHMGVVMYLDTSNSFSPSRIATIIDGTNDLSDQRGFDLPPKERLKTVMRSIICESVFDIFSLFEVLHQLEVSLLNDKVKSGGRKICLLIIDSISSLLAPIIGGKYPQGRSMMISVAMILKKLAYEHNLSVLVTNHTVSAGNGAVKPALGESWKAVPHVRLVISREHGSNICTATMLKHTLLASGRTTKFVLPS